MTERQRKYLYGIAAAAAPLLYGAGYLTEGAATDVLRLIAAILGLGTAAVANEYRPSRRGRVDGS